MTAAEFFAQILTPDLAWFHGVIPAIPASQSEEMLMLATAGQESNWENVQQTDGPARGFFQQQENDLADIFANVTTNAKAVLICLNLKIEPNAAAVYAALLNSTKLQVAMTRLNYWADWRPLPVFNDQAGMWRAYLSAQRPGKPSVERWDVVFPQCLAAVNAK
jgi:hypothetical protein